MQQQSPRALHLIGSWNNVRCQGPTPSGRLLHFFHPNLFFCQGRRGRESLVVVSPSSPCLMLFHSRRQLWMRGEASQGPHWA